MGREETKQPYRVSFTFGGLLRAETEVLVQLYHELGDWQAVREKAVSEGQLGKTRRSSAFRYFREIRDRLSAAYEWELSVLGATKGAEGGKEADYPAVLLAITARYYPLVGEFLRDLVRERMMYGPRVLESHVVRAFVSERALEHSELERTSDSTRDKLRSVLMRITREAGIAVGRREPYELTHPRMSDELRDRYCRRGSATDLYNLLLSDKEIAACR